MTTSLKRISYVEDEPDIRAVAELALTAIGGVDIDICKDGNEALARVPDYAPDLVLLDVMMPGKDGVSVFKHMKQDARTQSIPVIFMTAKVQRQEIREYLDLGAIGVITKPFDPMTLPDDISKLWEQR